MRFGGALLAGVVFALNLRLVTWLIYPHVGIWALFPWLLLFVDRLVQPAGPARRRRRWPRSSALQFLAGHPESSFHALLATAAFFALRLWQARSRGAVAPAARVLRRGRGGTALAAVA